MCVFVFVSFLFHFVFTQEIKDVICTLGDKRTCQISFLSVKRVETCNIGVILVRYSVLICCKDDSLQFS